MAKTTRYSISKTNSEDEIVTGVLIGEWWGIHKREDKQFVLTHIPSGMRVWSSKRKKTLLLLVQEPEFFDLPDHEDPLWRARIASCIKRFCIRNTNLKAKPKKQIGWE